MQFLPWRRFCPASVSSRWQSPRRTTVRSTYCSYSKRSAGNYLDMYRNQKKNSPSLPLVPQVPGQVCSPLVRIPVPDPAPAPRSPVPPLPAMFLAPDFPERFPLPLLPVPEPPLPEPLFAPLPGLPFLLPLPELLFVPLPPHLSPVSAAR